MLAGMHDRFLRRDRQGGGFRAKPCAAQRVKIFAVVFPASGVTSAFRHRHGVPDAAAGRPDAAVRTSFRRRCYARYTAKSHRGYAWLLLFFARMRRARIWIVHAIGCPA